ncbi:MAG: small multi-drug export protein [Candidatus Atribacteria bacterium]|nr:small multi-drug export protein [Candidatus Atribacteria bacterium]
MNSQLWIALLSFSPISEIRGSLLYWASNPVIPFWQALLISILFNLLPFFFVVFFLNAILSVFLRFQWFQSLWDKLVLSTRKKFQKYEKWEQIGLAFFIGIPLPFTGVWTGSLICFLMGWPIKKSLPFVLLGLGIASTIVSVIVLSGRSLFTLF